jgi:hypothetical protein
VLDARRAVEDMLLGIDMDMASYRVGLSQVGTSCGFSAKFGMKSHNNSCVKESVLFIIIPLLVCLIL